MKNKSFQNKIVTGLVLLGGFLFPPVAFADDVSLTQIVNLVNTERQKVGLPKLVLNESLNLSAELKAKDMLDNNYFAHTAPDGTEPWFWFEKANYSYKYAGENLAMDFKSAQSVFDAWMKSPTHRDNILSNEFNEIGVAIKEGFITDHQAKIAVQHFGLKMGAKNSENLVDSMTKLLQTPEFSIQEASVRSWKEDSKNSLIVYAKVLGDLEKVEVSIAEKKFPMEKLRESAYMNLITLNQLGDLKEKVIVVHAYDKNEQSIHQPIFEQNFMDAFVEEKEDQSQTMIPIILSIGGWNFPWPDIFKINMIMFFALCLPMMLILSVWLIEMKEQSWSFLPVGGKTFQ